MHCYETDHELIRACVEQAQPGGLYLEFGVFNGRSLAWLRELVDAETTIYGFDSFQGLAEPFNWLPVGTFKTDKRIQLPNVTLVEGWFADTLPQFFKQQPSGPASFINIDCDLYSSTSEVLSALDGRIIPGTIIYFDELIGFPGWRDCEYRALMEFIVRTGLAFEIIGMAPPQHVGVKILAKGNDMALSQAQKQLTETYSKEREERDRITKEKYEADAKLRPTPTPAEITAALSGKHVDHKVDDGAPKQNIVAEAPPIEAKAIEPKPAPADSGYTTRTMSPAPRRTAAAKTEKPADKPSA